MENTSAYIGSSNGKNDILKVIAILLMLVDHIGHVFFPQYISFRIVGRMSFPIFAYYISMGYLHSSNMKKYAGRLFLFGVLSQVPYYLLFGGGLNIFFTLLLGLICIYFLDQKKYFFLVLAILSPMILDFEYGYYGLFMIIAFYYFRENKMTAIFAITFLNILYFFVYNNSIQIFSLFALVLIYRPWDRKIHLNKYLSYFFYPLHISILYILSNLIGK